MIGERPFATLKTWFAEGVALGGSYSDASSGVANSFTEFPFNWNDPSRPKCPPAPCYFGAGPLNVGNDCSFNQLWSNHTGGGNFAMGDGSVRFISYSASALLPALATRAGGEVAVLP